MTEIPNIKPNSNTYKEKQAKEDDHRVGKVVKGTVKKKKNSEIGKFARSLIAEDAKSIGEYIAEEAPGFIRNFLRMFLQNMLDSYFPGNGKYLGGGRSGSGTNTTVRYDGIRGNNSSIFSTNARSTNAVYDYENLTFDTYEDADFVLTCLHECLEKYDKVRVFDLYDLGGMATRATDRNYGWTDLIGVKPVMVNTADGPRWMLNLPRAIPLY